MLEMKQDITQTHDADIHQRYTTAILSLFDHLPDIQRKILEKSNDGYTILGYKGTSKQVACSFIEHGVSTAFSAGEISGTAHGDGVYITPNFNIAKDFSELAVRREAASLNRKELLTPPDPLDFNSLNVKGSEIYMNALELHIDACAAFYASDECQKNMYFLIFFVKDFFNLEHKQLTPTEIYIKSFDKIYDYIEGALLGPGQWEIKFSKRKDIYAKIKILPISYTSLLEEDKILPNLPNGTKEMLRYTNLKTTQDLLVEQNELTSQETKFLK